MAPVAPAAGTSQEHKSREKDVRNNIYQRETEGTRRGLPPMSHADQEPMSYTR